MRPRFILDPQDPSGSLFDAVGAEADVSLNPAVSSDDGPRFAGASSEISLTSPFLGHDAAPDGQTTVDAGIAIAVQDANTADPVTPAVLDETAFGDSSGTAATVVLSVSAISSGANAILANPAPGLFAVPMAHAWMGDGGVIQTAEHADFQPFSVSLNAAFPAHGGDALMSAAVSADLPATPPAAMAELAKQAYESGGAVTSGVGAGGATPAQVQQALDESGLSVNGSGIKIGVLSDSFNDLGGAATDEADGALPSASNIDVIKDLASGGTDEGRAMMEIIHDIAPGASEAFYTAFDSEQDFANGILALAAAGCKVIVDDVSYFDEPFFQNGVVAQAIQTVEAEGVTYVTATGNEGSNGYQAAWTPISGTFDGHALTDAESFGGSLVQTVTINTEGTGDDVPLLLEWNQAYGAATSDLEILVFHNGSLVGTATNRSSGEPTNPWVDFDFTATGTYQIAIENLSGPNPSLIKEITEGDGLPATISGANAGTVFGHAMTPGAISAGAVSAADTPAYGFSTPVSESFSSSGAGTELLFANNGTALSSPDALSPVAVSGIDDIATSVPGGLSDFYGTSAASASLAGVAALMLAADPALTSAQVELIMEETATPMSDSAVSGAGLVNVDAAVAAVESLVTRVIQTDGSTSLTQVGQDYFLDPVGTSNGQYLKLDGAPVLAGQFGAWTPIGAVQTSGGYDVAWENASLGLYTYWTTDSSGNHLTDSAPMTGTSLALESLETVFNQDLNGDGTIGLSVHSGGTLNISTAIAATVTFINNSGTTGQLLLNDVKEFTGTIAGFTGNGTLSGSDQIDVSGLNYNSGNFSDSYSNGVLTVGDGTNTVKLDFSGTYSLGNFSFASDGHGGTIVYDPPTTASAQIDNNVAFVSEHARDAISKFLSTPGHDAFVYAPKAEPSVATNVGQADPPQHNSFSSDDRHMGVFHDAEGRWPQIPPQSASDTHAANASSDQEGLAAINFHLVDLHASHFFIA